MTRTPLRWAAALTAAAAFTAAAHAEDPWWVVKPHAPAGPAATLARPAASLGRPVAPAAGPSWNVPTTDAAATGWDAPTAPAAPTAHAVLPAGYDDAPGGFLPPRVARGQPPDPAPPGALTGPPPVPPSADGAYNAGVAVDQPLRRPFFAGCGDWFNGGRPSASGGEWFKSDCLCEESMISPVTNPFFFEDPRALTEIKPLFIIQKAPKSEGGGNDEFYGIQGRLALGERFSLVLNKLGFVSFNPSVPVDGFGKGGTGFAEVEFGPKWTFWRDDSLRNAAAVGLTIEAPVGSHKVAQDTGTLGLDPYVSYAQSFGDSSIGSFNFIGEVGYSFSADNKRTQFLHASAHLDYDILRRHKWYPLVEMNWFDYTRLGNQTSIGFEGADLFNFGSHTSNGRDLLTIAPGFRYKFTEWAQLGTAVEFPLSRQESRVDPRWIVDLIFRY